MRPTPSWPARLARPLAAIAVIVVVYFMTRLPTLADSERGSIADRFHFAPSVLPEVPGPEPRRGRDVHPALHRMRGWVSSVGAAVALGDLDGDGLPNDVCYVDPRTDQVIVAPVPGTGARYAPFVLPAPAGAAPVETTAPMGALMGDFDESGTRDLVVYYWGRTPVVHLRRGAGTPMSAAGYASAALLPGAERWYTNAATTADVDGDGHVDLVFGNYFPDGARILDPRATNSEEMQDSMSRAFNGGENRLLLWAGAEAGPSPAVVFRPVEGVFDERVAHGWALSCGAADLDGDLLPELYFGHDFGPDRLLHNRSRPGAPRFDLVEGRRTPAMPASKVLGRDSFKGMGCDFGDVNGDGLLDIFVSNIAEEYALEESHFLFVSTGRLDDFERGVAPYVDRSEELGVSRSGWGWESRLADFDNDGTLEAIQATGFLRGGHDRWPELHEMAMGNDTLLHRPRAWHRFAEGDDLSGWQHDPFFVRAADGRFYDVAPDVGLGSPQVSRGIATADVDGDGDLDFAVANQWEPSLFYRNDAPAAGAFLGLHLLLPTGAGPSSAARVEDGHPRPGTGGRPAIGAVATVDLPDGRRLVGMVDGGNGHSGARSQDVHFGLGAIDPELLLPVRVRYRDGGGSVRELALRLRPGWHTVMLGGEAADAASRGGS